MNELLMQEGVVLTSDQEKALDVFFQFYQDPEKGTVFLLRGAAGTGKTFLIRLLSRFFTRQGYKNALLAPTGRAAKVITRRSKRYAATLHRHLYTPVEIPGGGVSFQLKENKDPYKMCYIVDEASMVGDGSEGGYGHGLLADLFQYAGEAGAHRKVIFVGDPAQLPPVGSQVSPALDAPYLREQFKLRVYQADMTQVMRQAEGSEILQWASEVRTAMGQSKLPTLEPVYGGDVELLQDANEALDLFTGLYRQDDPERVLFLTYSNRFAAEVNKAVRHRLFEAEEELLEGEVIMVVRNNYAFGNQQFPFIANGEMGIVQQVHRDTEHQAYGLRWVDATLEFQDLSDQPVEIRCKVVLDLLSSKDPQLPYATLQKLALDRRMDLQNQALSKRKLDVRKDEYLNALQVKYGYAVTGHKAQGGQWKNVIVGFEPLYQGMDLKDYLRWSYTAITRAEEKAYLLNCPFVARDF